jgi:RNA polymerase sigma factor (sigma-70 family)
MGDKREFVAQMETAHGRQLRRFLSRRLRNAAVDVPDLIQEIYLRLLRIKDHEAVRNPQAYLYTVAGHVLHQHNLERSARAEAMDPATIAAALETADSAGDLADDLEIRERLEDVRHGLEEFSPRAYATLIMYRCEGLTLEQIGERLGVSHVMARKYLIRAIAYCDRWLEERE